MGGERGDMKRREKRDGMKIEVDEKIP